MVMVVMGVKKVDEVALCMKSVQSQCFHPQPPCFTKHRDRMKRLFVHSNVATPHHMSENRRLFCEFTLHNTRPQKWLYIQNVLLRVIKKESRMSATRRTSRHVHDHRTTQQPRLCRFVVDCCVVLLLIFVVDLLLLFLTTNQQQHDTTINNETPRQRQQLTQQRNNNNNETTTTTKQQQQTTQQ